MIMKKFIAITLCAMFVLCIGSVIPTKTSESIETQYYASEFNGATGFVEKKLTVNYSNYSEYNKSLSPIAPGYVPADVTCVPKAAVNLLGYYDRFYASLIPNFTPGAEVGNYYIYNNDGDEVKQAAIQVAKDMGMSAPSTDGATVSEFKTGMTKYCNRKSLSITYTSSMKSSNFNYDTAKSQILSGKPLIIFCSEFNISFITIGNGQDTITLYTSKDAHAMAVFGFTEITYTFSDGSTKVDKYLRVATGVPSMPKGLVYMGSDLKVDNAYAVNIY